MKDRLGIEIKPGDYVAYAVTAGRSGCLHIGKVIEISMRKRSKWYDQEVEKAKIEIQEYYDSDGSSWRDQKPPKTTYIEFPERIVVINHYVPKPKKARGPEGAEKVL